MPWRQRGLSIVELLVGLALGLFIVAAGLALLASNLREHRALLLENRLMQDLRTAADVVLRDLRRAGYWSDAGSGVWRSGAGAVLANPYTTVSPVTAAANAVHFHYSRDAVENHSVDAREQFGFRLRNSVIQMRLGEGNWQALTDAGTLVVTEFRVTPMVQEVALEGFCAKPCASGALACPPRQQVRSFAVVVSGRAVSDATVVRTVQGNVRMRNDVIVGACPV